MAANRTVLVACWFRAEQKDEAHCTESAQPPPREHVVGKSSG